MNMISARAAILGAAIGLGFPAAVSASVLSVSGGTPDVQVSDPGGNVVPVGVTGYDGASLDVLLGGPLLFTYVGDGNASYENVFTIGGHSFDTKTSTPGDSFIVNLAAGVPSFTFSANKTVSIGNGQAGLLAGPGYENVSVFYAFSGSSSLLSPATSGNALWLGFSDGGGISGLCGLIPCDNDHNDLVVQVSAVPEPATWLSLAAGLTLFGLMAGRRFAHP